MGFLRLSVASGRVRRTDVDVTPRLYGRRSVGVVVAIVRVEPDRDLGLGEQQLEERVVV
jgi:hypothetical protein